MRHSRVARWIISNYPRGRISPSPPPFLSEKSSLASLSLSPFLCVLPAIRENLSERSITSIRFFFSDPRRKISRSNNYEDVEIKAVPPPIIIRSGNINESALINELFFFLFLVLLERRSVS